MKYLKYNKQTGEALGITSIPNGRELPEHDIIGRLPIESYVDANSVRVDLETLAIVEKSQKINKNEIAMTLLRERRDRLLAASDWTQMSDSPLTTTQKTAWKKYRQALRDLPKTCGEITDVESADWPQTP